MADPSVTAATSIATGVISIPVLAAMGIDPSAMGAGLLGCTIVQSFIPVDGRTMKTIAFMTLGSVLFASMLAPVLTPWVAVKLGEWFPNVPFPNDGVRAATAGCLGAFAQPLVTLAMQVANAWGFSKLKKLIAQLATSKEGGDA